MTAGSTGWGDVATILPYTMYLKFGDKKILEQQYTSMKKWVDFLHNLAGDDLIVNDGFHFGDWLFFINPFHWNDKPGHTDIDFIATAFLPTRLIFFLKQPKYSEIRKMQQNTENFLNP
ncbi:MAG: hypothetical protein HC906_03390 [Bacteroidales bacterium]|nr:hypothetical protein [Bacteroidales bacterium]